MFRKRATGFLLLNLLAVIKRRKAAKNKLPVLRCKAMLLLIHPAKLNNNLRGSMNSNQFFKSNLTSTTEHCPEEKFIERKDKLQLYKNDSNVRNLCFEWDDGRKAFFNYAYLVSIMLTLEESYNLMAITFTSDTVALKGYNFPVLFKLLLTHAPRIIPVTNFRYVNNPGKDDIFVTEVSVKKN